jgi:hypothetical protein
VGNIIGRLSKTANGFGKMRGPNRPPDFMQAQLLVPPGAWPPGAFPMQATSTGTGDGRAKSPEDREAENAYWHQENEWRGKVEAEASSRYRRDLDEARLRAKERAKFATDVDLSALRGRGAEFVLEFTTVVVIIFAALILGVLGILGTEQIGTLLAAIAGYVLGRATTRGRGTAAEGPAAVKEERKDKARDKLGAER